MVVDLPEFQSEFGFLNGRSILQGVQDIGYFEFQEHFADPLTPISIES
jgi:hypothetical protein